MALNELENGDGEESLKGFYTWGRAKNYRLGRATDTNNVRRPELVAALAGIDVKQGACGGGHTCVVLLDHRLFVFGYSQYGQVGLGDRVDVNAPSQVKIMKDAHEVHDVVQVACGRYHTIALTASGDVYTWGGGKNGRLGHGDEKIRTLPAKVVALTSPVKFIACGYHSSIAITEQGVYSWGWGAHGQLGHGDSNDRLSPQKMKSINDNIVFVTCGDRHGFALTAEGEVYGWGSNEFGQLGFGDRGEIILKPVKLENLSGLIIKEISSGDRHSAALTNTGVVYTWGCGSDGQCGHGSYHHSPRPKALLSIPEPVVHVVCGHNFSMALTVDHNVYAWGSNMYGQLGCYMTESSVAKPTKIAMNSRVRGLACGHFHGLLWTGPDEGLNKSGRERSEEELDKAASGLLQKLEEDRVSRSKMINTLEKLCT
ncbi:hypothetical protein NDN08_003364 [Rhodosorus marinus]|uniref:RCC1-like domain-containing protein n=1 Tax=Rhodosorus marinus TaxID=101924 RepID=A0AAV8UWX9_9RHOD|nr:hypothetical protein NDN08_003364 [Rhodosorus marinus]